MKILLPLFIFILCFSALGQTKKVVKKKSVPRNSILATVLANLSTPVICGSPEWAEKEVYSGTIIKRVFDDSEMALTGMVIRDSKDRRTFINIDNEHVAGLASIAQQSIADYLLIGKRLKVFVYRCRRILYAYKIQPL